MTRRRLLWFAATGLVAAAAIGCGRGSEPPPQPAVRSLQVRLLVSAQASGLWQREAARGLDRIASELSATVDRHPAADASIGRQLVEVGGGNLPDLVFCVGADFANLLFTEAASHPDVAFVLVPGRGHADNVAGVELLPAGAGYVAGVVAANLRSSRVVGVLRGSGGEWLEDLESGFLAGFRSVRSGARTAVVESGPGGPWELAAAGAEIALLATEGEEEGTLAAAHDAGVLLVAADSAMLDRDPDVVAAAVHVDLAEAMVRLAREVQSGTFTGGVYAFDLGSGVLDVQLNPTLPGNQLPSLREALEVARSEVTAGIVEMEGLGI